MNIGTALKKIDSLSECELKHFVQLAEIDIIHYEGNMKRCNYPPYKINKYCIPYLTKLKERKLLFENKLKEIKIGDDVCRTTNNLWQKGI